MEEFFNSLEEIVQRPESRRSEKQSICSQNRRSVDRLVTDMHSMVHMSSSIDRAVDRLQETVSFKGRSAVQSTDWREPSFC